MSADAPDVDDVVERATNHWAGIVALALVVGGIGAVAAVPGLVLASGVFVAFAGYAWTASPVAIDDEAGERTLSVDRQFDDPSPEPGDEVTVTVAVRNEGDGLLPDVRIVDGVPPGLAVVDGSPRHGAVLKPGARTTFAYTVTARRGEHEWGPASITVADPLGVVERTVAVDRATTLRCRLLDRAPDGRLRRTLTDWYPGRVDTETGGSGLEFHSTREYRPTDPRTRIDWYRRARTGELGTVEFREQRAATVQVLVDARRRAYRAPGPTATHAVDRSVDAAGRLFGALLADGDRVGIAALGGRAECWLDPAAGDAHRERGLATLSTHAAFSTHPPERDRVVPDGERERRRCDRIDRLRNRLSAGTQVILLSPCCDDHPGTVARRLRNDGHAVTVVSPDPTAADSVPTRLARFEREDRLDELRRSGIDVLDWPEDEPLERVLAREKAGWTA